MKSLQGPSSPKGDTRATISVGNCLLQRLRAQPQRVELSPGRGLEQHVGGSEQRAKTVAIFLPTQIEHDRSLAAIVLPEEQGAFGVRLVLVERTDAARGTAAGRLHLDDVGAEARQRQPAVFRLLVGQFDDADTCQCPLSGRAFGLSGTLDFLCHVSFQATSTGGLHAPKDATAGRGVAAIVPVSCAFRQRAICGVTNLLALKNMTTSGTSVQ